VFRSQQKNNKFKRRPTVCTVHVVADGQKLIDTQLAKRFATLGAFEQTTSSWTFSTSS